MTFRHESMCRIYRIVARLAFDPDGCEVPALLLSSIAEARTELDILEKRVKKHIQTQGIHQCPPPPPQKTA